MYTALQNRGSMTVFSTRGRITKLLGHKQASTGERLTLRRLAGAARVPKDFVYRLDAGTARHVDLEALARLCEILNCRLEDILVLERNGRESV